MAIGNGIHINWSTSKAQVSYSQALFERSCVTSIATEKNSNIVVFTTDSTQAEQTNT